MVLKVWNLIQRRPKRQCIECIASAQVSISTHHPRTAALHTTVYLEIVGQPTEDADIFNEVRLSETAISETRTQDIPEKSVWGAFSHAVSQRRRSRMRLTSNYATILCFTHSRLR